MPAIKILGFDGLVPRTSATMLAENQAQTASNVKLYSRELRFWNGPAAQSATVASNARSIYKYYGASTTYWLTWASNNVDVARSPTTDTTDYRIYYTGDGVPKKSNETLVSTGSGAYPRGYLNMGVPAPTGAPTVSAAGGSGTPEDRVYVYTYVSTFGSLQEESAPSPASAIVSVLPGGTVTVNGFATAPTSGYNITSRRIYRSVSGSTADNYQFVAEIPLATTSYADSLTAAQLGEVIPTIGWLPPPDDLAGLLAIPGGSLAGFSGNTVYFSEPFSPHAWPLAYAINVPARIVALGVFGTSVVVMTDRHPYIINGGVVGAMSLERVPLLEPCLSKRSVVNSMEGVTYVCPDGLMQVGPRGAGLITESLFKRSEWQTYQLANITAGTYDGRYIGFLPSTTAVTKSLVFSPDDIPALSLLEVSAYTCHVDSANGDLFYLSDVDNKIYQLDGDALNPLTYTWKSKRFILPQATSFSVLKLDAGYEDAASAAAYNQAVADIIAYNQSIFSTELNGALDATPLNVYAVNGSALREIPPSAGARSSQVNLYIEGDLAVSLLVESYSPVRIPPFKGRSIEIEIVGNIPVRSVMLATGIEEFKP